MAITLVKQDSGFKIEFKGRTILEHTSETPCVLTGVGRPAVESLSGFFKVKEALPDLKGQVSFDIVGAGDREVVIKFGSSLMMSLTEEAGRLEIRLNSDNPEEDRLLLRMPSVLNERIYGGGEQYSRKTLNGKKLPIWISEPGVGRRKDLFSTVVAVRMGHFPKWYNTYYTQPTFLTSKGLYFHSHSSAYSELDFQKKEEYGLYFWDIPERITIGVEGDLAGAVSELSAMLGRQPSPPDWIYDGFILGVQGGAKIVKEKLARVKSSGVKVAGLWCQDWEGRRKTSFGSQLKWAWEPDETLYPDFKEYIADLRESGVRYLGYNNTFLTPGSRMWDEAVEKGYFIRRDDGSVYTVDVPFDPAGMVDFTNPEAVVWLKGIIRKNMIDTGLSGWMADFGEMVPHDTKMFSGESGLTYHNRYPVDWAKLNREVIEEAGLEDEIFTFMRAGYAGGAKYNTSVWNGDQLVDWSKEDGLPSSIMGSLTLGLCGVGYTHSDVGGYTTLFWKKRSKELLMRWAEYSAFTQTMRSHEGNRPENNVQYGSGDQETLIHLARMVRIFTGLKPYHTALSSEYREKGLPAMRLMEMHYPDEIGVLEKYSYQYLYGRDLLVAPVIKPGKTKWKVCFPTDNWVHLWSGHEYSGGIAMVDAPLGKPPVFYRKKSEYRDLFSKLREV
ncbi:MAG: alpha-glucosidase [Spirochaetales bacterium]|nr:alpha-glucosidase [Spirochaetales bacterium]